MEMSSIIRNIDRCFASSPSDKRYESSFNAHHPVPHEVRNTIEDTIVKIR
jgi:DNA-binding cell septation regulator SpoVG